MEVFHRELEKATFRLRNGKWYYTLALEEKSSIGVIVGVQSSGGIVPNTYLPLWIDHWFAGGRRSSFEFVCLTFKKKILARFY